MQTNAQTNAESKYGFNTLHKILRLLLTPLHLLFAVFGGYVIAAAVLILSTPIAQDTNALMVGVFVGISVCSITIMGLGIIASRIYFLVLMWGSALLSYVVVSADEVEVRMWPYYHVSCHWEYVERIVNRWDTKRVSFKLNEVVTIPENRLTIYFRPNEGWMKFMLPATDFNPNIFTGYPKGKLAYDLARYAPHLFPSDK